MKLSSNHFLKTFSCPIIFKNNQFSILPLLTCEIPVECSYWHTNNAALSVIQIETNDQFIFVQLVDLQENLRL